MGSRIKLGIIFGGKSGEHEVSLRSARSIMGVLDRSRYDVVPIGITQEGRWVLGEDVLTRLEQHDASALDPAVLFPDPTRPGLYRTRSRAGCDCLEKVSDLDVVFPVLHGTFGEDGTIQGLFEMAGIAYVGAGVLGSAVGMDKALFKELMRAHHVPVVPSLTVTREQISADLQQVVEAAEALSPYPIFVKPANLGSSVGVSKCTSRADLLEGLQEAARYDRRILVEKGINGREIEVSVLGNQDPVASIPGEIVPNADFYSYAAKYLLDTSELVIPAKLEARQVEQVQRYSIEAFKASDCSGMARVDYLLDRGSGELFLSEINTIPGFTSISMYPKLWESSGIPYPRLVERLVDLALERHADRVRNVHTYGGAHD